MKKQMKWIKLSLLAFGALGIGAAGVATAQTAAAETVQPPMVQGVDVSSFVMENGAGVRVSGDGLRFSAEMDKTTYDALETKGASYGMLIVPENYLTEGYELTEENVFKNNKFYFEDVNETPEDGRRPMINLNRASLSDKDEDGKMEIYGAMTDIGTANIYREFVGVAYVQVPVTDGETTSYEYKFASFFGGDIQNNTRSMYYVAQKTLESNWTGDKQAVQTNYIDSFNTHIAGSNYKFGYIEKHILTTLEGEKETLMEEVKYGDLNSEVTAQFYNDNALYSTYYFADEEMPTSKLYANGKTVLEVNYQEVAVDFDNLAWNAELTSENYKGLLISTEWGNNTTETPYSVTTEIPEGGVAGSYLYYAGAKDQKRADIQIQLSPAHSKGYYESLLNTGLPYEVKFDVYVENANANCTETSTKVKLWNDTSSFNSNEGKTVTMGQWKTFAFDLSYLVNNWGNYRLFGLELQGYYDAGQKVNFYLGNIRIEEKPKMWAAEMKAIIDSNTSKTTDITNLLAYNYGAKIGEGDFNITNTIPDGGVAGNYLYYKQTSKRATVELNFTCQYEKAYYELLANCGEDYKVTFDVYVVNLGTNTTKVKERHWLAGDKFDNDSALSFNTWYTVELDLATLVNKCWGKRQWGLYKWNASESAKGYFSFYLGNMKLEKGTASTSLIVKG